MGREQPSQYVAGEGEGTVAGRRRRAERSLTDEEEGGLVGERKGKKREWLKGRGLQLPNGAGGCSPWKRKR